MVYKYQQHLHRFLIYYKSVCTIICICTRNSDSYKLICLLICINCYLELIEVCIIEICNRMKGMLCSMFIYYMQMFVTFSLYCIASYRIIIDIWLTITYILYTCSYILSTKLNWIPRVHILRNYIKLFRLRYETGRQTKCKVKQIT